MVDDFISKLFLGPFFFHLLHYEKGVCSNLNKTFWGGVHYNIGSNLSDFSNFFLLKYVINKIK